MKRIISVLVALFALMCGSVVFAQSESTLLTYFTNNTDLVLASSPSSPAPGATVTITAQSPYEDLSQSQVTWDKDGKVIAQGQGQTSVTITAPLLGKTTTITASTENADGTTDSSKISITPTNIDLLVDSDSYVPPFYRGRALPGPQTNLRLQAIPDFVRSNGSLVPTSQITFTWRQDGRVMGSLSGNGKSSVILPAALLFGTTQIEVDAASVDGNFSGSASVAIPTVDPALVLYEDNPVFGFTYYHALSGANVIPDLEMTFSAVPYFAQAQSPNDPGLQYDWTVNGSSVASSPNDPSELTLNAKNSSGQATIGLTFTDSQNAFVDSNGSWAVTLGAQYSTAFETAPSESGSPFTNQ